jgi:predicted porin
VSGIGKAYGGAAKVYTGSMIANGRGNYKPETWILKLDYQLPVDAYKSDVAFHLTDTQVHDSRGKAFKAYYAHYRYFFTKRASVYLRYEYMDYKKETISDASYFRIISSYEF